MKSHCLLAVFLFLQGCIVGRVTSINDSGQISSVVGATVTIYPCETSQTGQCSPIVTTTDSNGFYAYDAYATGSAVAIYPDSDNDSYKIQLSNVPGYYGEPHVVFHQPVWQLSSSNEYYTRVPDIMLTPSSDSSNVDTDGDGITDDVEERYYLTDATNPDTDNDGLTDGSEIYGSGWFDFPSMTDPFHRDIVFEVDSGIIDGRGGFPTPIFMAVIDGYYSLLPISNPDGKSGIDVHFRKDGVTSLPSGSRSDDFPTNHPCYAPLAIPQKYAYGSGTYGVNNSWNRNGVRHASFCPTAGISSPGGIAMFGIDPQFAANSPTFQVYTPWDQDSSNDLTEVFGGLACQITAHEIGHLVNLTHAGGFEGGETGGSQTYCGGTVGPVSPQGVNYKPNYPSIMNYGYRYGVNVDWEMYPFPHLLDLSHWDSIGFSDGSEPDIDETCLSDVEPWYTGGPKPSYLEWFAYLEDVDPPDQITLSQSNGDWVVDWDVDGTASLPGEAFIPRRDQIKPHPIKLRDYDDISAIEYGLPHTIPMTAPVFDAAQSRDFTYLRARGQDYNYGPWVPGPEYLPDFGFGSIYWENSCPGDVPNYQNCPHRYPTETYCGWQEVSCTYTPATYNESLPKYAGVFSDPVPMPESGLSAAEEIVLERFTGKKGRPLKKLIKELGLTQADAKRFAKALYNPLQYKDPVAWEERFRKKTYKETGRFVESTECDKEAQVVSLFNRIAPNDKRPTSKELGRTQPIRVCR